MLHAMEVCAANFYAGPARLNAATRSVRPFAVSDKLRLSACCCYMRLFSRHKHAESHITVSFSPGKGADIFFFLAGSQFDAQKKQGGGSRSGMAFLTMALLQGRKRRGHDAPSRSLLGRPWPTEVTSQQPASGTYLGRDTWKSRAASSAVALQ